VLENGTTILTPRKLRSLQKTGNDCGWYDPPLYHREVAVGRILDILQIVFWRTAMSEENRHEKGRGLTATFGFEAIKKNYMSLNVSSCSPPGAEEAAVMVVGADVFLATFATT